MVIISDANCVINRPIIAPVNMDMDQVIALARVSAPKNCPAAYETPDSMNSTNATTGMIEFRSQYNVVNVVMSVDVPAAKLMDMNVMNANRINDRDRNVRAASFPLFPDSFPLFLFILIGVVCGCIIMLLRPIREPFLTWLSIITLAAGQSCTWTMA